MHKDKEENSHHDSHYRARELAALAAYDHHHLDGEMFLQVSTRRVRSLCRTARIYDLIWTHEILKMHIGPTRALILIACIAVRDTCFLFRSSIDRLNPLIMPQKSICREWDLISEPRSRNGRAAAWNISIDSRSDVSSIDTRRKLLRRSFECFARSFVRTLLILSSRLEIEETCLYCTVLL